MAYVATETVSIDFSPAPSNDAAINGLGFALGSIAAIVIVFLYCAGKSGIYGMCQALVASATTTDNSATEMLIYESQPGAR